MTVERPKVLLPLVNTPMIEYTLEWLAMNRVEETFVFICAHAEQIQAYLAESKWAKPKGMKVRAGKGRPQSLALDSRFLHPACRFCLGICCRDTSATPFVASTAVSLLGTWASAADAILHRSACCSDYIPVVK